MSNNLLEIWQRLESRSESAGLGYSLDLLESANGVRIFAIRDNVSGHFGFLVEMPDDLKPKGLAKLSSRKLEIVDKFEGLATGMGAVGLMLKDSSFTDLFSILV